MESNSKHLDLYQLSREIKEGESKEQELQARRISNAYREVEGFKPIKPSPHNLTKETATKKSSSNYAVKIKQTLKEMNAQKSKELEGINYRHKVEEKKTFVRSEPSKLQKVAISKFTSTLRDHLVRLEKHSFKALSHFYEYDRTTEDNFIKKWNTFRLFKAWKDHAMAQKTKAQKFRKQYELEEMKNTEIAQEYRIFMLLRKCMKGWSTNTKNQVKRKKYDIEVRKLEVQNQLTSAVMMNKADVTASKSHSKLEVSNIKAEKKTTHNKQKKVIEQNSDLQSKLRGFLDGLKQKIENKEPQNDRLKTIKQKTEESEMRIIQESEEEQSRANHSQLHQLEEQIQQEEEEAHEGSYRKPLTNEELQKKRKQLQAKRKSRKQNLQKLRREKQSRKQQEQIQRINLEKQIEAEQKKIKQERYRHYLKSKQDQEQWEAKEKELSKRAEEYNEFRIKKFYGFMPLLRASQLKKEKTVRMVALLTSYFKFNKFTQFFDSFTEVSEKKISEQYSKMIQRHKRNLLKRYFHNLKTNHTQQLNMKQKLSLTHQYFTQKAFFKQWERLKPTLQSQNFEWQRPRRKRAEQFRNVQLKDKFFHLLKSNKEQQQKERFIREQKLKIKSKIKGMVIEVNYDQFDQL